MIFLAVSSWEIADSVQTVSVTSARSKNTRRHRLRVGLLRRHTYRSRCTNVSAILYKSQHFIGMLSHFQQTHSKPRAVVRYTNPTSLPFGALQTPKDENVALNDGTLVGCAPKSMFFYQSQLHHQKQPGATFNFFAAAIEKHARQFQPVSPQQQCCSALPPTLLAACFLLL